MLKIIIGIVIGGAIGAGMGYFGKCSSGGCPLTATPLRGGIYGACMGLMFAMIIGGGGGAKEKVPQKVQDAGSKLVVHVGSDAEFKEKVLNADVPVLVDMYADWCGPCRALAPTIDKLAVDFDGRALIVKLNVDTVPGPPRDYGVSGIPVVFFFYKGEMKAKVTGVNSSSTYARELEKLLEKQ